MIDESTKNIDEALQDTKNLENLLKKNTQTYRDYMRDMLDEKGIEQKALFLEAYMPEKYSYKLISGEKKPHRDYLLRFCYAGKFTREETDRALKLCGLSPLYAKVDRDKVLIIGFNKHMDVFQVDELLKKYNMEPLKGLGNTEE